MVIPVTEGVGEANCYQQLFKTVQLAEAGCCSNPWRQY